MLLKYCDRIVQQSKIEEEDASQLHTLILLATKKYEKEICLNKRNRCEYLDYIGTKIRKKSNNNLNLKLVSNK